MSAVLDVIRLNRMKVTNAPDAHLRNQFSNIMYANNCENMPLIKCSIEQMVVSSVAG